MKKSNWTKYHWIKSCAPKPVSFKLKNISTGKIINGKNVRQWCKDKNLGKNSHISIYDLLGNKIKSYKNFTLPRTPFNKLYKGVLNKYRNKKFIAQ